ncbi:MAG: mandelate racemase/muconate lactonizing enzyme family protein [Gemmataceae bacterium]|nr:mandelate racemase/muconate lactonizing enzyme family protein [Gemmataceae bacterium]MCI0740734.1 mandelate racemase/muconate lactonizing enzyme family protein [Gemmataceae bacterium]
MNRRSFLSTCAALPVASAAFGAQPNQQNRLKDLRITRVTGFTHVCQRPKLVGYNARLGVHGRTTRDNVLRIATNSGVEGVGSGSATQDVARKLLGRTLNEIWRPGEGMNSPLGRADHALYDLVGKALKTPSWRLFGGNGPEWVPIYDGSIYFNDLLPEYKDRGVKQILSEVEDSLKAGHRAFKIKVGRGFKWMERKQGFQRDVDVVRAIRKLVGKEVKLMVDANNGYDLDTTMRWLDEVADANLYLIEEMFPEDVDQNRKLKDFLQKRRWNILVADGESAREVKHFDPYIEAGVLDVLQPDIRAFGFTLQWELSRRLKNKADIKLAPHNWGSFLGVYMQAVLARGIPNFLIAEQDTATSDLFDASAFTFREGRMRVPDVPGCGLVLREDVFKKNYAAQAWTVSS